MNRSPDLGVEQAGRLAVTAVAADLEHWARGVSRGGWVHVDELVDVIEALRAASIPCDTPGPFPDAPTPDREPHAKEL